MIKINLTENELNLIYTLLDSLHDTVAEATNDMARKEVFNQKYLSNLKLLQQTEHLLDKLLEVARINQNQGA